MNYEVHIQPSALEMIAGIKDRRVQAKILDRLADLAHDPELQGKPLGDELAGFRSIRLVGQRYRAIYCVERERVAVIVVAIGLRKQGDTKDIYALAKKLIRLGLLG